MKKTLLLLTFCVSFVNAQYVSKATITSNKTNNSYDIKDVKFLKKGKLVQFKLKELDNMYAFARVKDFTLNYDENEVQEIAPKSRDVYFKNNLTYPDGVYKTKEDFVNKMPLDKSFKMTTNMLSGIFENPDDLVNFYDLEGKFPEYQQRDFFAVVKDGDVYFNIKELKNISKKQKRPLAHEIPNFAYVRVKSGTDNGLYFELPKTINNYTGLEMFGAVGAITSTIINNNQNNKTSEVVSEIFLKYSSEGFQLPSTNLFKGIVFDTNRKEFVILTFCDDLNTYLKTQSSPVVDCEKDYNISKVREVINL